MCIHNCCTYIYICMLSLSVCMYVCVRMCVSTQEIPVPLMNLLLSFFQLCICMALSVLVVNLQYVSSTRSDLQLSDATHPHTYTHTHNTHNTPLAYANNGSAVTSVIPVTHIFAHISAGAQCLFGYNTQIGDNCQVCVRVCVRV